jgi:hypothetical protein
MRTFITLLACLLLLTACTDDSPTAAQSDDTPDAAPEEEQVSLPEGCDPVPADTVTALEDVLLVDGEGTLEHPGAVEHDEGWLVAARIIAPGLEETDTVGVWVVDELESPGSIMAADSTTDPFTEGEAAAEIEEQAVDEARACVQ